LKAERKTKIRVKVRATILSFSRVSKDNILKKSFKVRIANLIIQGTLAIAVLSNQGSMVPWRCWGSNNDTHIPSLTPLPLVRGYPISLFCLFLNFQFW